MSPYASNSDLPEAVRSRYSSHCQDVWRNVWNSVHERTGDESRAFASANSQAQKCEGAKSMSGLHTATVEPTFKIFAPMLKASMDTDGKRRLHGIASSTIKDRHGDKISLSALAEMERSAAQNLTIFLNHEYKVPEDVAGHVERAAIRQHPQDGDIHDLALDIVINESNPRAVNAWEAIQNGTQLGLSIGAKIPDGGATRDRATGTYQIDHIELLETSLVGVPANPRSWVEYAVKSLNAMGDGGEVGPLPPDIIVGESGPELIKAPMSSEHRTSLPDSAFACPAKRKYPHHTASGAVDKAHLRNALSRCGDASNDQCGCSHIRAHAKKLGMGEAGEKSFEDLVVLALSDDATEDHFENTEAVEGPSYDYDAAEAEPASDEQPEEPLEPDTKADEATVTTQVTTNSASPEITNATVNIKTPYADVSIDTGNRGGKAPAGGSSQDALESNPETEDEDKAQATSPWAGILPTKSDLAEPDVIAALQTLEPTVVASLHNSSELLKAVTRELIDTKAALAERNDEYAALEEVTKKTLGQTAQILDKLSNTPLGRRAVLREANEQFASLKSVMSEEFLTILKRS